MRFSITDAGRVHHWRKKFTAQYKAFPVLEIKFGGQFSNSDEYRNKSSLTKIYAFLLKIDVEITHFLTHFFDKFVSKTQNNFSKQNKAWRKFQNIIS